MVNEQYIRCPDCGSQIPFDPYALARGERFACPQCPALSIGIDPSSQEIVNNTLNELENLKKSIGKRMPDSPSS
ncbi:hypothetical protein BJP36_19720 [Moorena producens JHB]|uniref:Uncharacterized protein n=1 Tax=Moorena producens (strain JHB) TaxID=1454205 RepID=A0A1D9G2G5_MOOP1|nr:hypothetical protein [Moorena producens]AOY81808.1 hypothetical protein BJP36_19720 [Moorena producens JHB]